MKSIQISVFLYVLLALAACASEPGDSRKKDISPPSFSFETVIDSTETPHSQIYLSFDDNKLKIAQINTCLRIVKEEYQRHEIPAKALDACGGWWAGSGDYFYLIKQEDQYLVYQGFVDEMQDAEQGYHYTLVGRLSRKGSYSAVN